MKLRLFSAALLVLIAGVPALAQPAAVPHPRFELRQETVLLDEPIPIIISGLAPGRQVVVRLRGWGDAPQWSSSATFAADAQGVVDLTRMPPSRGDYQGVDPMGLFWSARRDASAHRVAADIGSLPNRLRRTPACRNPRRGN